MNIVINFVILRLTKTEARLSQSEDENKRLREDLKEMLDSNTELQQIIVSDDSPLCPTKQVRIISIAYIDDSLPTN